MNLKETYFVIEDLHGKYYTREFTNEGPKHPALIYARLFKSSRDAADWLEITHGKKQVRLFRINLEIIDEKP